MPDYRAEYVRKSAPSYLGQTATYAKAKVLDKFGAWIEKYRGGMPAGFAATIAYWESSGNPTLGGDASLDEYGLFQVAGHTPRDFGMPAKAHYDPETNVALAMLEYQTEVVRWTQAYPTLIDPASADAWMLARLAFAIGVSGSRRMVELAKPTTRGKVYDALVAYVDTHGGIALGSQSAELIWYRIKTIPLQWRIGQMVAPGAPGLPTKIPAPPAGPYTVKPSLAAGLVDPVNVGLVMALVAIGAGLYWFLKPGARAP